MAGPRDKLFLSEMTPHCIKLAGRLHVHGTIKMRISDKAIP